jgi:hypothetical protein
VVAELPKVSPESRVNAVHAKGAECSPPYLYRYITRDSRIEHLMQVYGDADFAGDINTRKAHLGWLCYEGRTCFLGDHVCIVNQRQNKTHRCPISLRS